LVEPTPERRQRQRSAPRRGAGGQQAIKQNSYFVLSPVT
jgi:hypothetical protein